MKESELSRIVELAGEAIVAAVDDDAAESARVIGQISKEHGPDGVFAAMVSWCDTCIYHCVGEIPSRSASAMWTYHDQDGRPLGIEAIAPHSRWAVQLIAARFDQDWESAKALFAAVPEGSDITYIGSLLMVVATTIRNIPHGSAMRVKVQR